jgi:DNA-binding response OmpR family regulator
MDTSMQKPVLLIVDDHEEILEYLTHYLSNQFEIVTAGNGMEAMEIFRKQTIGLVVSDVMMPVMDGFELCREIKSNLNTSHVPVILLTAKTALQAKIEGLELGADVYIEKPFSPEYLSMQINSLLINRNKVRNYYANNPLAHIKTMANTRADEEFLENLNNLVIDHMEDPELDVEHLARFMNLSRPSLYRKLKEITEMTPNEIINNVRLRKAAELLISGHYSIHDISFRVGYTSATHFSRNFQKRFGMLPSEYIKSKKQH